MAQRIALVPCINPLHQDDTPSMAVYDHGKKKLQVFCFGCKFHGWVTPSQLSTTPNTTDTKVSKGVVVIGEHLPANEIHTRVIQFFADRRFDLKTVPWRYITWGSGIFGNKIRPYFRWSLHDFNSNTIGYQTRFLDTEKPKIKTEPVGGKYPQYAWHNPVIDGFVRITESWVDAQWLDQKHGAKKTLILLGTQPTKVDWYRFLTEAGGGMCMLYLDGDTAGIDCAHKIQHTLTSLGSTVVSSVVKGKKVYEL